MMADRMSHRGKGLHGRRGMGRGQGGFGGPDGPGGGPGGPPREIAPEPDVD
jgi:hypothetical protein